MPVSASVFEVPLVDMTAINKKVLGPCCTETGWITRLTRLLNSYMSRMVMLYCLILM